MNAPLIWIGLPGLAAGVMLVFNRSERVIRIIGLGLTAWLAWAAWILPVGEALTIGPLSVKVAESMTLLGREFTLADGNRGLVAILYLITSFWIMGTFFVQPGRLFPPISLGIVALLTAALAVEPFLYAALIIEVTVLVSIPLLSPPEQKPGRGIFRFLAFQTFGMPFILFTGWMLEGVEASPSNLGLVVRAGALLGIGFSFLLAVFPFHSWIPMLMEEVHPYIATFIFFMLPTMVSVFAMGFFDRFVWLRESTDVQSAVLGLGGIMTLVGGLWTATERHLGRIFGYVVVSEIGLILLSIGMVNTTGSVIFFWLIFPRAAAYLILGITMTKIKERAGGSFSLSDMEGLGRHRPLVSVGLLAAHFSLAGLPLLAGFPSRMRLWEELAVHSQLVLGMALAGNLGLIFGGLRIFSTLFISTYKQPEPDLHLDDPPKIDPQLQKQLKILHTAVFVAAMVVILLIGLVPQAYLDLLTRMGQMFTQIGG